MQVAEIWRYPVKTMAGERLTRAVIGPLGIEGDRIVHVAIEGGRVLTSRTHTAFLAHRGMLGPDGEPLVDGRGWRSPEVAAMVAGIGGPQARLVRDEGPERFDGMLALDCFVLMPGTIAVGDAVTFAPGSGR